LPDEADQEVSVKRSTDRILTTHVGSLARPHELLDTLKERENGRPYDAELLAKQIREAVADRVARQVECGIDVVTDGEMSKTSFIDYVKDRLAGFEIDDAPSRGMAPTWQLEFDMFPEYYEGYLKKYSATVAPLRRIKCTGPISYAGQEALQTDIANLKAAMATHGLTEAFLPVAAPSSVIPDRKNEYYASDDACLEALAEAMRDEYRAIVDAGLLLQLDDARAAVTFDRMVPPGTLADYRRWLGRQVEILNHALDGIPEDRVRYHVCWGSWPGPHTSDVPLEAIVDLVLQVKAGAYLIEAANPRHEHEWRVWQEVPLPDAKVLIPGVISHATNVVEHPELVAERLTRFAGVVGRERVIGGTDCGFAQGPFYRRVHPSIMWAKLESLAEGARIASARLWLG
jgi:5-methyltetrahydropteroyltriglutamate--homocysteine methyltransferase